MSNYLIKGETLTSVANAIREKTGSSEKILISEMLNGISQLTKPNGEIEITENGSYNVSEKASAIVNVPIPEGYIQPSGAISITKNGTYVVNDKDRAVVNVPIPDGYIQPSGSLEITENGSYNIADKASATVNVQSGLTINGIIKQYKVQADKTVNAGDFVEFVNAVKWGNGYPIAGEIASICAFELTNNRVLVIYSASNTYYPTAIILTLSGTTITAGTAKTINSKTVADQVNLNATQIESNKFLLAYTASSIGEALIITVDESNVITVGTVVTFESGGASEIHPIKLNESKVLIAYISNSNSYGTAIVLSISGTTITAGTKSAFNSASTVWLDCVALTDSKALVTFSNGGNSSYGTAVVLSISGTSITAGTKKVFESASILKSFAVALTESKVLVFYSDGGNSNYGTAVVLSVSGTSITAGSAKVTYSGACMGLDMAKLSENTALVVIKQSASYFNYAKGLAIVLSVSGTTVTAGTAVAFEPNSLDRVKWASVVAFSQNSALIVYGLIGYTNGGRYQGLTIDGTTITPNTESGSETLVLPSETVINGIAKTGGSSGETVEVYVNA